MKTAMNKKVNIDKDIEEPLALVRCFKCGFAYPKDTGALSREFSGVEVCSHCGYIEAMEDYESIRISGKRKYLY